VVYSNEFQEKIASGEIKYLKLEANTTIKPFDCGNTDLNDFLINDAKTYLKYLSYSTYIFEDGENTIAYFSLANDRLNLNPQGDTDLEDQLEKSIDDSDYDFFLRITRTTSFPSAKIGRLAVNKKCQRKSYGNSILRMLTASFIYKNKTGCQFITIDVLNTPDTLRFYEQNEFVFVSLNDIAKPSRQMYKNLMAVPR